MKKFDKIKFMQAYKKASIKENITKQELLTRGERVKIATTKINNMYIWIYKSLKKQIAV